MTLAYVLELMGDASFEIRVATEIVGKTSNTTQRNLLYHFTKDINGGSNDFQLRVTDPDDPLFLYDFEMSSAKYQEIKRVQKLFCEFTGFPKSVFTLLSAVNTSDDYQAKIDTCEFETPNLLIQQVTQISLLVHIQLPLVAASDARLKDFLSQETRLFKNEAMQASEKANTLERSMKLQATTFQSQVQELKDAMTKQVSEFEIEKAQIIRNYTEKMSAAVAEKDKTKELIEQGFASKKQAISSKFDAKIEDLKRTVATMRDEKAKLDAFAQRQTQRVELLESQLLDLRERQGKWETESENVSSKMIDYTRRESSLQSEIQNLRLELQTARQTIDNQKRRDEATGSSLESLKMELKEKDHELENALEETRELSRKASERDWIAEKSKEVIMKERSKVKYVVDILNETRSECSELKRALRETQSREGDAEEGFRKVSVSLDREKQQSKNLQSEVSKLREEVGKLEVDLATERQYAGFLRSQIERKEGLSAIQTKTSEFQKGLKCSGDSAQSPPAAERRSIPAAFFEYGSSGKAP